MVRGLRFCIYEVEGLYYPCSKNKGADQLRGYREADLHVCFRICKNPVFSRHGSFQGENRQFKGVRFFVYFFYNYTDFCFPRLAVTFFLFPAVPLSADISMTTPLSVSKSVFLALLGLTVFDSKPEALSVFRFLFCFPVLLAEASSSENISSFTVITSSFFLFWPCAEPWNVRILH